MSAEVEHVLSVNSELGEGPIWSAEEQALYWVDIRGKKFNRLFVKTGQHESFEVGQMLGVLALRAKGGLVLGVQSGFAFWDWQTKKLEMINDPENGRTDMRFNDGKVDPQGRFWAGSMNLKPEVGKAEGSLYRLDPDGSVHKMETGLAISNGLGWSPDRKTMYLTDSLRHVIYAYDYDAATGNIENRRDFIKSEDEWGVPDGLTVDSEGGIWSARWGGWKVDHYGPDGKKIEEIKVPVECPTSCTFGGENLDELYITSCWENFSSEQRQKQPQAGDIFRYRAGVKGQENTAFAG
jgi:sugar lactone lactonase YvrE